MAGRRASRSSIGCAIGRVRGIGIANAALRFDRQAAHGMRLNIASGTAVRFEPGQQRTVELVDYAGARRAHGFRGLVQGAL